MAKEKSTNWFMRHKVITVILALVVIGVISSAAGGSKGGTSSSSSKSSTSKAATTAKIGQAANDGKFEFTVSSVQCGQASVGSNQYLTKTAQGQYCLLNVSVKNIGDQA